MMAGPTAVATEYRDNNRNAYNDDDDHYGTTEAVSLQRGGKSTRPLPRSAAPSFPTTSINSYHSSSSTKPVNSSFNPMSAPYPDENSGGVNSREYIPTFVESRRKSSYHSDEGSTAPLTLAALAIDEDEGDNNDDGLTDLLECPHCQRRFNERPYATHIRICEKVLL